MKKLSLLFTFFVLLTAFTCEDEPLDQDILDNQDTNTSCEQASLNTAAAALAFINQFEDGGDYTELCNAYKEALENQIEACGDPDGAIQQAIDALGDCIDPEDFTDCQAAENAVNLAQINFENATDENYNDLCVIYKTSLENQITECGDEDGSLQAIIDGLGDCSNDSQPDDCETVTADASIAQTAFGNATDENYEELCNAYKEALQVQISVCGDADGSLQQLIDELGDCNNNQNVDCTDYEAASELAFENFENADSSNYSSLCDSYKTALQDQIDFCGDPTGELQLKISLLGNCGLDDSESYVKLIINGEIRTFIYSPNNSTMDGSVSFIYNFENGVGSPFVYLMANMNVLNQTGLNAIIYENAAGVQYFNYPQNYPFTNNLIQNDNTSLKGIIYGIMQDDVNNPLELPLGIININY